MKSRRTTVLFVALTLTASLAGESAGAAAKKATKKPTSKATTTTRAATISAPTVAPATTAPSAKSGGSAVYAVVSDSATGWFPPTSSWSGNNFPIVNSVFEQLLRRDENGKLQPNLLASLPTPSGDYKAFTFTVRPGIKFHNGEALDGASLTLNLEALRTGSQTASGLAEVIGCVQSGPLSATCTLKARNVTFASQLGLQSQTIAAPAQILSKDTKHPIGTGPFKCVGECWTPNESMKLVRNPDYWRKGLPKLDSIEFRPVPDEDQRLAQLQTGQIQFMDSRSFLTARDLRKLAADKKANVTAGVAGEGSAFLGVSMYKKDNPLLDLRLRQAVASSLDLATLVSVRAPGATPADGLFPSKVTPGYLADSGYPKFDLDKAKALVDAYKKEKGVDKVEITIGSDTNSDNQGDLLVLKQMIEKSGISVKLGAPIPTGAFGQAMFVATLPFDLFRWTSFQYFASEQYSALAGTGCGGTQESCANWVGRPSTNFSRGTTGIIEAAFDQLGANSDPAVQKRAAETVLKEYSSNLFYLFLWRTQSFFGSCAKCGGTDAASSPEGVKLSANQSIDTAFLSVG